MICKSKLIGLVAGSFILATLSCHLFTQTKYIVETPYDIQEALVNIPEKVPVGHEVYTLAGEQLTPGVVPSDFRRNQEIYNDIALLQNHMIDLMQMVLDLEIRPHLLPGVQKQMSELITMISNAGIRYDLTAELSVFIRQLNTLMQEIIAVPKTPDPQAPVSRFMLFKARLEVILAEIENLLLTKLVE